MAATESQRVLPANWEARQLVSSDSHVMEPASVWSGTLDPAGNSNAMLNAGRGTNPATRAAESLQDGVAAEILYPTRGMTLYGIEDVPEHEAAIAAYNRWLADFCNGDPKHLYGLGMLACYDPDVAIAEMKACKEAGMRGVIVWLTPHPDLPFTSGHYDRIWQAAVEMEMPVNFHIATSYPDPNGLRARLRRNSLGSNPRARALNYYYGMVNEKLVEVTKTLYDLVFAGVFERFPKLKVVFAEFEASWVPHFADRWDYYYNRPKDRANFPIELSKTPSEYVNENVYVTFFHDRWLGPLLSGWGQDRAMWANDYPHSNSTWPNSRHLQADLLAGVDEGTLDKVLRTNCLNLYKIDPESLHR